MESLDPRQLASLLSGYLEGMTEIVFAHEGTVAKIIGDAIHVLFGAPAEQPDAATRAIACALALDARAEDYRREWNARGVPLGVTRIGVHAGPAIVGNFGGGRLFDYTAYGDTINAAARLEAVNKQLGTRICVSAAAAERAEGFCGRPVGDLRLRGRSEPMRAYEPLAPEESRSPATAAYAEAFAKLEAHDPGALAAFAALLGTRPADPLAQYHLKRLLNGAAGDGDRDALDCGLSRRRLPLRGIEMGRCSPTPPCQTFVLHAEGRGVGWTAFSAVIVVLAGAGGSISCLYRKELDRARKSVRGAGRLVSTNLGPIEYAETGSGAALLSIHGAGGGFDQGLAMAAALVGDGFRVLAPSRFGDLGAQFRKTPLCLPRRTRMPPCCER